MPGPSEESPLAADGADRQQRMVRDELRKLSREVRELSYGDTIDRISLPTALEFCRDYVSANKPCIIQGALEHWPALTSWTEEALAEKMHMLSVTVDFTPNGRADAVVHDTGEAAFMTPLSQRMAFSVFQEIFQRTKLDPEGEVPYLQNQNGNLVNEFAPLLEDVDSEIPWASEAFGCAPEAVNLWIGDDRSETSFHKDHYENMYAVVAGSKTFTLLPPCDVHRMHLRRYPVGHYHRDDAGCLRAELLEPRQEVLWCPVNPYPKDQDAAAQTYPHFFNGPEPLRCTVHAGDLLYLPSMWYHYVQQTPDATGRVIAINYWHDMRYDVKYACSSFISSLAEQANLMI